ARFSPGYAIGWARRRDAGSGCSRATCRRSTRGCSARAYPRCASRLRLGIRSPGPEGLLDLLTDELPSPVQVDHHAGCVPLEADRDVQGSEEERAVRLWLQR